MPLDPNDAAMLGELAIQAALDDERLHRDPPWAYRLRVLATWLPPVAAENLFAPHPDSVARHLATIATPEALALIDESLPQLSDPPTKAARAILAILNALAHEGEPAAVVPKKVRTAPPKPAPVKRVRKPLTKVKAVKTRKTRR